MDNAGYLQAGFRWLLGTLEPVGIGRGMVGTCLLVDDYIFCAELALMGKAWDRALPLQAAAARLRLSWAVLSKVEGPSRSLLEGAIGRGLVGSSGDKEPYTCGGDVCQL